MPETDGWRRQDRNPAPDAYRRQGRGVPDGLLVGAVGFLLGLTTLCWTATGLSGLATHGSWPHGVTFTRTPMALRSLLTSPHDVAAAWPATPPGQLSGYGLFWGLFIGQVMVLVVLTVFALGTTARWRAARAGRRPRPAPPAAQAEEAETGTRRAERRPEPAPGSPAATAVPVVPVTTPGSPTWADGVGSDLGVGGIGCGGLRVGLHIGVEDAAAAAEAALRDAEGAALVVTSNRELYASTAGARAKLGPCHVYDPTHRTQAPVRLRWAPHQHCEDMAVARVRANALLAPLRVPGRTHDPVHDTAQTLLRCFLHAAAAAGEPFRAVHRWATSGSPKDAIRILRTDTRAVAGAAGELEAALTAHRDRRTGAEEVLRRALTCMSRVHIRNACTPARNDVTAWASFVAERGTLYAVGEPIEAPYRDSPETLPLLTALTSAVVEHGRLVAERSSAGRLDPPLTVLLDHPATLAPLPELPALLDEGDALGLEFVVYLRSEEQKHTWWPDS
jgi:hypothetical protein